MLPYVSAALIIAHRDKLLIADYIEAMQLLMRGLTLADPALLVVEAERLKREPTPSVGAHVAAAHHQMVPEPPVTSAMDLAKARLRELASAGTQRLFSDTQGSRSDEWSPKTEARLHTESTDPSEQRRRAMLSLDDRTVP